MIADPLTRPARLRPLLAVLRVCRGSDGAKPIYFPGTSAAPRGPLVPPDERGFRLHGEPVCRQWGDSDGCLLRGGHDGECVRALGPQHAERCHATDVLHSCVAPYGHEGDCTCGQCDHQWTRGQQARTTVTENDLCWYKRHN